MKPTDLMAMDTLQADVPEPRTQVDPFLNSTSARLTDHHADLLALGWRRRERRLRGAVWDFADLTVTDDRMDAALTSLVALGETAHAKMLVDSAAPLRGGEMFALTLYALAINDAVMLERCAGLAAAVPGLLPPWLDAFEWAPASAWVRARIEAMPLSLRLHLAGLRFRDFDGIVDDVLACLPSQSAPSAAEICAALGMIRACGRCDLALAALRYVDHETQAVRLAAAKTLLVLAPDEYTPMAGDLLWDLLGADEAEVRYETVQYLALLAPDHATQRLDLLRRSDATRHYLLALGWLGRIDAVPVLMTYLDDAQTSRLAAASLTLLTGSDPLRDGWLGQPLLRPTGDEGGTTMPSADPDVDLPWPARAAFAHWWRGASARFNDTQRYFAGMPITSESLVAVLTSGPLQWRTLAAVHFQKMTRGSLFPTRLPAPSQRALFPTLPRSTAL
ncbi:hypothetical protein [Robbsia andropogonis]|uniref:hypothetical protein n=1 Tax=Robbsia andropogonis TaxID=28092 RepID=UPI002A69FE11|nr:hypothetical protein [Robbsia andropogonis]